MLLPLVPTINARALLLMMINKNVFNDRVACAIFSANLVCVVYGIIQFTQSK